MLVTRVRLPACAFVLTLVFLSPPCPVVTLFMFLYVLLSSGRRFMRSNSERAVPVCHLLGGLLESLKRIYNQINFVYTGSASRSAVHDPETPSLKAQYEGA